MTANLTRLLLQLSESGEPAILWGRQAKPYFGKDFERLLNCRLLVEEARAEEWDVCDACECHHGVRVIQEINGRFIAACPVDQRGDSVLDPEDMRSFRIDAAALMAEVAKASGFDQEPTQAVPGVWHLGKTTTKRGLFVAIARERVLAPGLIAALRSFDPKSAITVVGPSMEAADTLRFAEAGIHFVATAEAFVAEGTAFALDALKLMPPASIEARLTLFRSHSKLLLDGGELELPPISFKLLCLLAEQVVRGDGVVSRQQIDKHLWSTVVSKTAAADAIRNLRDLLKKLDEGSNAAALVRTLPTQGYILDIAASDIRLMD
ncbi:MAG: winged helix-turn-helix domain-containing protein [Proteobacteria bacterium]|nr:winged helix-turn-helix domain-containing protein [Pseudomonadota bacterium]